MSAPGPEPEPEPAPEPEPEPEQQGGATAMSAPDPEPTPEPRRQPEPEPRPAAAATPPGDVPSFVEYSPDSLVPLLAGAVLAVAGVAAAVLGVQALADPTAGAFVVVLLLVALAIAAGVVLTRWDPATVTVREGTLHVERSGTTHELDLRDPDLHVDLDDPGSRSWTGTFTRGDDDPVVVRRSDVDPRQFTAVVERARAERGGSA